MKHSVVIIGGGPAGFMVACKLDPRIFDVHLFEQKKSLGRKFLVAGKGGFNLTHASSIDEMISKYYPSSFIRPFLTGFDNIKLREYLKDTGIPTFVGSSNRVFPNKSIKPIQVLNAFLDKMKANGVSVHLNSRWVGFEEDNIVIESSDGHRSAIKAEINIYGLGGKSWSKTGSDGLWTEHFESKGIHIIPFSPSNCGIKIQWPEKFLNKWEGHPIKNIVVGCGDYHVAGEALVTKYGLEGGAIYALSRIIMEQFNKNTEAIISLDLKPTISDKRFLKFQKSLKGHKPVTTILKEELKLERIKIALIKSFTDRDTFVNKKIISTYVKDLKIPVVGLAEMEDAISTVGGVSLDEVDNYLQLRKMKNHYVIGEMLDWDAPTGGYLLQACFSMGAFVADHLNKKFEQKKGQPKTGDPFI